MACVAAAGLKKCKSRTTRRQRLCFRIRLDQNYSLESFYQKWDFTRWCNPPVAAEGATEQMMKGNSHGFNWKGLYVTSMIDWHAGWKTRANELSEPLKLTMVLGEYFIKHYRGHFYAKAQNLTRQLTQAYDDAFKDVDLLLMPTLPITATKLPASGATVEDNVARA